MSKRAQKSATAWEAFAGIECICIGTRPSGKPHNALVAHIIVAFSAAEARKLEKLKPGMKFVEKPSRPEVVL